MKGVVVVKITAFLIVVALVVPALAQSPAPPPDRSGGPSPAVAHPPTPRSVAPANALFALKRTIRSIDYDEAALSDALDELARGMRVNMIVRWRLLEPAGVDPDTPVTVRLTNIGFGDALIAILQSASGGFEELAYSVTPDMIVISTFAQFNSKMILRVYDVRDLTMETVRPSIEVGRVLTYVASLQPVVSTGAVAIQPVIGRIPLGVSLGSDRQFTLDTNQTGFGASNNRDDDDEPRQPGDPGTIEELVEVIIATVEPTSWRVNGGEGTIVPFKGQLVVRNSPYVHQLISRSYSY